MLEKGWIYNMIKEIKTKLSSFEIFTIFRNEENSFILDSAMDEKKLGRFSFISSNPFKVLKYKNTLNNPLDNLQEELKKYKVENKTHLPFIGGAVGYLSYDLGNYIEKLPRTAIDDTNVYDLYFGLYNWVIVVDHLENKTYIATPDLDIEEENKIITIINTISTISVTQNKSYTSFKVSLSPITRLVFFPYNLFIASFILL